MQLSKVIHPEVLLGLRGYAPMTEYYNKIIGSIGERTPKGWHINNSKIAKMFEDDPQFFSHYQLCKRFKEESDHKIYYIPKEFAKALASIDKVIPVTVLKKGFTAFFQIGDGGLKDDAGGIEGGYVAIDSSSEFGFKDTANPDALCFALSYINEPPTPIKEGGYWPVTKFMCEIESDETLSDLIAKVQIHKDSFGRFADGQKLVLSSSNITPEVEAIRAAAFRCFVNAAVYVHSSDPDVAKLVPTKSMTKPQRAASRTHNGMENMCMMPMTVLNKNYALGRQYSVDTSLVQTHMRWQRCGEAFSQVKLIWVKEHERNYNKEIQYGSSTDASRAIGISSNNGG